MENTTQECEEKENNLTTQWYEFRSTTCLNNAGVDKWDSKILTRYLLLSGDCSLHYKLGLLRRSRHI